MEDNRTADRGGDDGRLGERGWPRETVAIEMLARMEDDLHTAATPHNMISERAQRAIDVLLDDAIRQAGLLLQSQIERVLDRRKLDPVECLSVYRTLDEQGLVARQVIDEDERRDALDDAAGDDDDADSSEIQIAEAPEGEPDVLPESEPTTELLSNLPAHLATHSLLTAAEEVELGRAVRLGREMAAAGAIPEDSHALEVVRRGAEARERMIRSNFRLVLKVAYPYAHTTSIEVDDLLQEGLLGLMRAVEKFDHSKGFRFSTYAFWWIRQAIMRAIADKGDMVRLPVHVKEKVYRLRKAIRVLRRFNQDRFPSIGQLADELHWPRDKVQFLLDLSKMVAVSLDAPLKEDEHQSLVDLIADDAPGPLDIVAASDEHETIKRALATLSERERAVITKRFGLDRIAELTLEEIGQHYDLTRERIRQIESKALKKLAHPVRSGPLRELLETEPDGEETDEVT